MLLSLTTTHRPATDLGYLLHKHPDNVRTVVLPFGDAQVFFAEAGDDRCTAVVLVEVDPVGLVRRGGRSDDAFALSSYVNDRPYVASSLLSVALGKLFATAMAGRCDTRPEVAATALPILVDLPVVPCAGGADLVRRCFAPLGYDVRATPLPLDDQVAAWGDSRYLHVTLRGDVRVADVLTHLYVLLPVLDDDKHYWVGDDEIDKLLAKGGAWLATHPERDLIVRRYLRHQRPLTTSALERLADDGAADEGTPAGPDAGPVGHRQAVTGEAATEAGISLGARRTAAVMAALQRSGATRVVDLGCGEGRLLQALVADRRFHHVTGVDVSHRALERAASRLQFDRLSDRERERITLLHSGLTYRDRRLEGYDAATLVEVVEHLDASRLGACEQTVFAHARPGTVIVTTPNREHNVRFTSLPAGHFRHRDHRFEWTRAEFGAWARGVAGRHGYDVRFEPVGDDDPEVGSPTQMAVFTR